MFVILLIANFKFRDRSTHPKAPMKRAGKVWGDSQDLKSPRDISEEDSQVEKKSVSVKNPCAHFTLKILIVNQDLESMLREYLLNHKIIKALMTDLPS